MLVRYCQRALLDFQEMHDIFPEERECERNPDIEEDFDHLKGRTLEEAKKDLTGSCGELIQVSYLIVLTFHI